MLVPLVARIVSNHLNRRFGMAPIPFDWSFLIQCILYAIGLPLLGEALFEGLIFLDVPTLPSRIVALGTTGIIYGFFFAIQPYFRPYQAVLWGMIGGVLAAVTYHFMPYNILVQAMVVMVMCVFPILALELPKLNRRRVTRRSPEAVPMRGFYS